MDEEIKKLIDELEDRISMLESELAELREQLENHSHDEGG